MSTVQTLESFKGKTVAEQFGLFEFYSPRIIGEKNAYLTLESSFETMRRNGELNTSRSTVAASPNQFRLTMKFEDKSVRNFSLCATNYETAVKYAPHLVQDIVENLGIQRVVWNLEGQNHHFSSCEVDIEVHPDSIVGKLKRAIRPIKNFLFMDDEI